MRTEFILGIFICITIVFLLVIYLMRKGQFAQIRSNENSFSSQFWKFASEPIDPNKEIKNIKESFMNFFR
jgi:hypothetical protein